jgi:hypothetical protein
MGVAAFRRLGTESLRTAKRAAQTARHRRPSLNRLTRRRPVPRFGGHHPAMAVHPPLCRHAGTASALEIQCGLSPDAAPAGGPGVQSRRLGSRSCRKLDTHARIRARSAPVTGYFQRPDRDTGRGARLLSHPGKIPAFAPLRALCLAQLLGGRQKDQLPLRRQYQPGAAVGPPADE